MSGLALFGGTFDPVHNAHLQIAQSAADAYSLEKILFIPSGRPPHRAAGTFAPFEDRYAMVSLACACDARFQPSRLEAGSVRSYSIDTIEQVRSEDSGPLHFLIGADAFAEIQTWHRWQDVVALVTFIVVSRPGAAFLAPPLARVLRLDGLHLQVSSSGIRHDLAQGLSDFAVPTAVAAYIQAHSLYRSPKQY